MGGCTLTKHRLQPWHAPFPAKPQLPPPKGRSVSGGAAAGYQLKPRLLHAGSPHPVPIKSGFLGSFSLQRLRRAERAPAETQLCCLHLQDPPPTAPSCWEGRGAGLHTHCLLPEEPERPAHTQQKTHQPQRLAGLCTKVITRHLAGI